MDLTAQELFSHGPFGVIICDAQQRIIWCNSKFVEDTRLDLEQVTDQHFASLPLEATDKQGTKFRLFSDNNEQDLLFLHWTQNVGGPTKQTIHYFSLAPESIATDKLTERLSGSGLANRTDWLEFLEYEVSRSRRYESPLSLMKLQVIINGHSDERTLEAVNQGVKDTLTDILRWADMIGNTSQLGFLMVLPETPENALENLQTKLTEAIEKQLATLPSKPDYQLVFAAATWNKNESGHSMLKRAREILVQKLDAFKKSA